MSLTSKIPLASSNAKSELLLPKERMHIISSFYNAMLMYVNDRNGIAGGKALVLACTKGREGAKIAA
jgi:hypothetical protein